MHLPMYIPHIEDESLLSLNAVYKVLAVLRLYFVVAALHGLCLIALSTGEQTWRGMFFC